LNFWPRTHRFQISNFYVQTIVGRISNLIVKRDEIIDVHDRSGAKIIITLEIAIETDGDITKLNQDFDKLRTLIRLDLSKLNARPWRMRRMTKAPRKTLRECGG
jgi:hypothetical protein